MHQVVSTNVIFIPIRALILLRCWYWLLVVICFTGDIQDLINIGPHGGSMNLKGLF